MRIGVSNINKEGLVLSKKLINKGIFKYNGIIGRAMFELYDKGYQSSPAIFDIIDFRRALYEDFPQDFELLIDNLKGQLALENELIIKYALIKSNNEEFKSILSSYYDIFLARKALDAFDTLLNKVRLPKKNDLLKVKIRLGISGSVKNYNSLPLDEKAIQDCIYVREEETIVRCNTADILVKGVLKRLGVSEEVFYKYKAENQSLFISGIDFKSEIELLPVVISGQVHADGVYGEALTADIANYYSEFSKTYGSHVDSIGYEQVIFNDTIDERISLINEKRKKFGNIAYRELYVTTSEVVFALESAISPYKKSYFEHNILHLGVATLSHENRTEFSKINTLNGLCGEFIHESEVKEKGYFAKGLPISIKFGVISNNKFRLSELKYYPIYSVYYAEDSNNVEPLLGTDIQVVIQDKDELFKRFGVSNKADLYQYNLHNIDIKSPFEGVTSLQYCELIADLTTALMLAECGELDYEMCGLCYSWVNDDIFYRASTEAEIVFKSYGF